MKSLIIAMLTSVALGAHCQSKTEKVMKEYNFEVSGPQNTIIIDNINGNIYVEGYDGKTIQVEVEKTISGKTTARFERGWEVIQPAVIDRADTLIFYMKGVCQGYIRQKESWNKSDSGGWGYDWNNCQDQQQEYDYKLDYKVKVPREVNLVVSTINEGNVEVKNSNGVVKASNINGHISLVGINDKTKATTINGNVDIEYVANPNADCRFYTLNGDINALFKKGLSSDVSFKSFNGDFYTNLPELVALPVELEKSTSEKGTKFEVNGNRYRTGKGGALLDFETFNGDVYLKEQ